MGNYSRKLVVLATAAVSALSFGDNVVVPLADGGCAAQVNAGSTASSGPFGVNSLTIGGTQEISQQVFVLGVNGSTMVPINDYSAPNVIQISDREAIVSYTSSNFLLSVDYVLTGSDPTSVVLTEALTLTNTSANDITYNLVDLNHFKLEGANGGTVSLLDSNDILQTRNLTTGFYGVNLAPTHWAINNFGTVAGASLSGGNLSDSSALFSSSDPGFAFQWRGSLGVAQSLQVGTYHIVTTPEPASLLTLGGLAVMALRRRKREAKL